jgi:hypothetical protein
MCTDLIEMWHQKVRPEPSASGLNVQTGCHFEEVAETVALMRGDDEYSAMLLDRLHSALTVVALGMKHGTIRYSVDKADRKEFLDGLCDQQVTAVGVAHCAGMKATEGLRRVNESNWSKFDVNGNPIFNEHGKVMKGPSYKEPNLEGCY